MSSSTNLKPDPIGSDIEFKQDVSDTMPDKKAKKKLKMSVSIKKEEDEEE